MEAKLKVGLALVIMSLAVPAQDAAAALLASDSAANAAYASWEPGDNGGTGWGGPWSFRNQTNTVLTATNGNRGWFSGSSINNNSGGTDTNGDGDINTAGRAWGTYSNSTDHVYAIRPFSGSLNVGQSVRFSFDNGNITTGNVVGVRLISDTNDVNSRVSEIRFVGGDSFYTIIGTSPATNTTTVPFTREGVRVDFLLTSASTYRILVTHLVTGTTTSYTGGTLNSNPIRGLAFRNQFAGSGGSSDAFLNNIAVAPEPGTLGVFGLMALARRSRRSGR